MEVKGWNILITGASGLIARYVIENLAENQLNSIYAVSSRPQVVKERYLNLNNVHSISNDELSLIEEMNLSNWIVIHTAFSRKNEAELVVQSLNYANVVYTLCKKINAKAVINISSRSVYKEPDEGTLNTEESEIGASGLIGLGKYAVELLTEGYFKDTEINYTNLRIASVNELKMDLTMIRPLNVFVDAMIKGEDINVVGGMQVMSYIDPRDVATAIEALINIPSSDWKKIYNVGTGWMCTKTLLELAKDVVKIGKTIGLSPVEINVQEKYINMHAGLDITRIQTDTNWSPVVTIDEMILSLYKMKMSENDCK